MAHALEQWQQPFLGGGLEWSSSGQKWVAMLVPRLLFLSLVAWGSTSSYGVTGNAISIEAPCSWPRSNDSMGCKMPISAAGLKSMCFSMPCQQWVLRRTGLSTPSSDDAFLCLMGYWGDTGGNWLDPHGRVFCFLTPQLWPWQSWAGNCMLMLSRGLGREVGEGSPSALCLPMP